MKVYFTYSAYTHEQQYHLFLDYFKKNKHINYTLRKVAVEPGAVDIEEAEEIFNHNTRAIKNADIVIAEISYASGGVGYDISYALQEKKPVIIFYNMSFNLDEPRHIKYIPDAMRGNNSKYLLLREYNEKNIEDLLTQTIKEARQLADSKFILIISPEIDRYLEWNVKTKNIAKAEITRQAIENMMTKDEAYQKYQKDLQSK